MRRRLIVAIALVATASVVLFAIPLAVALRQSYRDEALLRLQRDAAAATRQIDLDPTPSDAVELPEGSDAIAVYGLDQRRRVGRGPATADAVVREALRSGRPSDATAGGRLTAAVPLLVRERVVGAARVSRDDAALVAKVRRAWLWLAALAALVLVAAVAAAVMIGRRLSQPLERLGVAAVRLGDGDFAASAPATGIAEVDAAGEALRATGRRLGEMIGRERSFSADASHQMRTPLAALRLEIEAMQLRADAPPEVPAALEQVDRLQATIETLLAVARGRPPAREHLDLRPVIADLEGPWRERLAGSGRPLRVVIGVSPPIASASGDVVREILAVLLENAVVHGAGAVTLEVLESSAGWLTIEIGDEGAGIAPDLGDVFARRGGGGHGIGLALARSLAAAEGASLVLREARPSPTFVLTLPRPPPAGADAG